MKRFVLLGLLVSVLSAGCELSSNLGEDQIVGGVDFSTLFAAPTQSELNAVKIDWASREYPVEGVQVALQQPILLGNTPGTIQVVSHLVGSVKHFGAIIYANGLNSREAPMVVYSHGGDNGISVDQEVQLVLSFFADVADQFVYVIPSFRDEAISFQNTTWKSDGPPSPWDRDVDDALSLVNVAASLVPGADPDRIGVLGFSRGAGVGMLMDVRNEQVDAVLDFFGPTDFFGTFVQEVSRDILLGRPRNLPGLEFLSDEVLLPYQAGEVSLEEVRLEMVRRSAVFFADRIERLQIHHGTADQIVPVSQAEAMIKAMENAGKTAEQFQSFLYEGGDHNPLTLEGSIDRAKAFLLELKTAN
jgi:dipeptidyl aminopeptidase/acylaminoacyl peptidase